MADDKGKLIVSNTIVFSNVPCRLTKAILRNHLRSYGDIKTLKVYHDKSVHQLGYAIVEFTSAKPADNLRILCQLFINGHILWVGPSISQQELDAVERILENPAPASIFGLFSSLNGEEESSTSKWKRSKSDWNQPEMPSLSPIQQMIAGRDQRLNNRNKPIPSAYSTAPPAVDSNGFHQPLLVPVKQAPDAPMQRPVYQWTTNGTKSQQEWDGPCAPKVRKVAGSSLNDFCPYNGDDESSHGFNSMQGDHYGSKVASDVSSNIFNSPIGSDAPNWLDLRAANINHFPESLFGTILNEFSNHQYPPLSEWTTIAPGELAEYFTAADHTQSNSTGFPEDLANVNLGLPYVDEISSSF